MFFFENFRKRKFFGWGLQIMDLSCFMLCHCMMPEIPIFVGEFANFILSGCSMVKLYEM